METLLIGIIIVLLLIIVRGKRKERNSTPSQINIHPENRETNAAVSKDLPIRTTEQSKASHPPIEKTTGIKNRTETIDKLYKAYHPCRHTRTTKRLD